MNATSSRIINRLTSIFCLLFIWYDITSNNTFVTLDKLGHIVPHNKIPHENHKTWDNIMSGKGGLRE